MLAYHVHHPNPDPDPNPDPNLGPDPNQVLAYYAHLAETATTLAAAAAAAADTAAAAAAEPPPRVHVAEAHLSWEEYFGSQGPYAQVAPSPSPSPSP